MVRAFKQVRRRSRNSPHAPAAPRRRLGSVGSVGRVIEAVAAVPHPPLLAEELAGAAATETAALRAACRQAATWLSGVATRWVAVGADLRTGAWTPATRGSFRGFGVDVTVALGADADGPVDAELPLPLLVAGLLRAGVPDAVRVDGVVLEPATDPAGARQCGAEIAEAARGGGPVGLLVLGDGPATLTPKAPGALDPRADAQDGAVAAALASADVAALAALDPDLCAALGTGGRVPWQVLAGAAAQGDWVPTPLHDSRPFGVGYHVAVWERS